MDHCKLEFECPRELGTKVGYDFGCVGVHRSDCSCSRYGGLHSVQNSKRKQKQITKETMTKDQKYFSRHREKILRRQRKFYRANRTSVLLRQAEYRRKNRVECRARRRNWEKNNQDYRRQYIRVRLQNDLQFRLIGAIRARVRCAIRNGKKSFGTVELIGCSLRELRKYLERQFKPGMTWKNWGLKGWHVDHIRPCSSFDLSDPEQQKQCFHFTNLQPLWAEDNLSKGSSVA